MNLVGATIRQKMASSTKTLLALALVLTTLMAASVPALAQTEPKTEPRAGQEEGQQQEESGPQPEQKEGQQPGSETEEPQTEEAQPGEISATGRIGRLADYPGATHGINDEATGAFHALRSDTVDLDAYADSGQRVTVYGIQRQTLVAEKNPVLDAVRVVPAGVEDPGGDEEDEAALSFELTVDGDPPAGAAFYGNVVTGEGGPGLFVPLADPDGDRVYTGSTTVDRFGPGPRPVPPGVEPVSLPVRIVQDYSEEVIKDFGTIKLDGDKTFSASVSFPVDDCPIISPTPEQCGDGASGGSISGSSGSGGPSSGGPSSGGPSSGGSSSGGSSSGGGVPASVANGLKGVLPSTGGGAGLWMLGAAASLAGGGFLIRRFAG